MTYLRQHGRRRSFGWLAAFLMAGGCVGADGADGPEGDPGPPGSDGSDVGVDPSLTPAEKAFAGLGGKDAIEDLTSFRLEAIGTRYFPGEELVVGDAPPLAHRYAATLSYDVTQDRLRLDMQRTLTAFGANVAQTYSEIVRGDLGHVAGSDGLFGMPGGDLLPAGTSAIRKQHRLLNPQLILRDVAAVPGIASEAGLALLDGSLHHLLVVDDDVYPITLYVNAATGRISKLSTRENDHLHRDVDLEVIYLGWQADEDGVRFPSQVALFVDGALALEETRTAAVSNVAIPAADLEFPEAAAPTSDPVAASEGEVNSHFHQNFSGFGIRLDSLQTTVQATVLVPRVFLLTGGSHNSLAIEQANGVVLVEAPLYPARTRAILAWAATAFPGKSVTHVIATHFHDDHSGGVRELAATGAIVVSDERSSAFYREVGRAPSTIEPDTMANAPVSVRTLGVPVGGARTLADPQRPIIVRSIANSHAFDMVMVHLPEQDLLFESDLFSPGFPPVLAKTGAVELRDELVALDLTDVTIVGGHAGTATFPELEAYVAPQ